MTLGILKPYVDTLQQWSKENVHAVVNHINSTDGFLTGYQIPLVSLLGACQTGPIAEIGCWKGKTTRAFKLFNPNLQLHCVDTFMGSEEHQEELKGRSTLEDFSATVEPLSCISTYVTTSEEASKVFADEFFDIVWIDAAHDYDNVKLDIESWTPKIRHGGLLVGHDYPEPNTDGGFEDLTRAVNECVRDSKLFSDFGWFCGIWAARKLGGIHF